MVDGTDEIFGPLFDGAIRLIRVDPVEMWLQVAVGAGDVANLDGEEDVAAVWGPVGAGFYGGVGGDAAGLRAGPGCARRTAGGGCPHICLHTRKVNHVDFYVFVFFLALVDGVADES